jgi:uncharacterized NAD(P)/FAD-binding protein YdhS
VSFISPDPTPRTQILTALERSGGGRTVAVIGGGFSGVITAIHLALAPDGPRVRLIERSPVFARGVAYATDNPDHLLNVRVGNMSALPDEPNHFVDWLSANGGWTSHGEFVTRGTYGAYLQDLLRQTVKAAAPGRLLLDTDEVTAARYGAEGWRLTTRMGRELAADAVVLATGVLPPSEPNGIDPAVLASPDYIANPWAAGDLAHLGKRVLLLGTGLTMVDVALGLGGEERRLVALSRRGLLPRAHARVPAAPAGPQPRGSAVALLRQVREAAGADGWRYAVDGLRPHIQDIWASWPAREQSRFLRHLRPWWDAHRHRLAPAVSRQIGEMVATDQLIVRAGRLHELSLTPDGIGAAWSARGRREVIRRTFDAVVNCTGPLGDLQQARDPLLRSLIGVGALRPDRWALGAEVDRQSRPLNWRGEPTPGLFVVGPLSRGRFWEITAIPDIRVQAKDVANAARSYLAQAARLRV